MLNLIIIIAALSLAGFLAFSSRLKNSQSWQATVTPLASIMGSGFLVCAPLLANTVGNFAVLSMAVLLLVAFAVGGAIRFNIRHFEPIEHAAHGPSQIIDFVSRTVLAGAYFVSVSYYLQLLGAFLCNALGTHDVLVAKWITTALLCIIGGIGIWRGLGMLEKLERYAIAINLGVIGALVLGLAIHNGLLLSHGQWKLAPVSSEINFTDFRILLGLLIVVQGFETSRYLGESHPAEQRIATMRRAQIISTIIYLAFLSLVMVLFRTDLGNDVTAIVAMTAPVASVLPLLISIAAIGSQFSAAVADNAGAGGLIEESSRGKVPIRYAYMLILIVTLAITWETNVTEIISYASRAFALYYTLQCAVAFCVAWKDRSLNKRSWHLARFAGLVIICLLIFALGLPAE